MERGGLFPLDHVDNTKSFSSKDQGEWSEKIARTLENSPNQFFGINL